VRFENKEQYAEYFDGPEATRLFKDQIADKLTISQILLLLKDRMLTTGEIAAQLGIKSSNVAKFLTESSRQRLIRFDQAEKRYALV
jgi:DNA-binding MarR family transcriptional regulator